MYRQKQEVVKLVSDPIVMFLDNKICLYYKGNNKITELRTILQRESQNS
jgi:hypothetical protein